jgi:hypothetical protein
MPSSSRAHPVTGFATAPAAVEVNAALDQLLTRAGLPPGQYVRVSPTPAGPSLMYWVEVSAAGESALSKALLAILGYRVPAHSGSFTLYQVEAQLVINATKHSGIP